MACTDCWWCLLQMLRMLISWNIDWQYEYVYIVLLSKQVNYNQVVMKCQILQECFLQNFNMQKFQNMEHSNSRTFQGLSRVWNFFFKIQGLSRTSQGPYEPCKQQAVNAETSNTVKFYIHTTDVPVATKTLILLSACMNRVNVKANSTNFRLGPLYSGGGLSDLLAETLTSAESLTTFHRLLKTHLFRKSFPDYLLDIH